MARCLLLSVSFTPLGIVIPILLLPLLLPGCAFDPSGIPDRFRDAGSFTDAVTFDGAGGDAAGADAALCETGYDLVDGQCINTRMVPCAPLSASELPANAEEVQVDVEITFTEGEGWSEPTPCSWVCISGYVEDSGKCFPEQGWLLGWSHRIGLTTDHEKISADLVHFPMAVFLKAGNGDTSRVFDNIGDNPLRLAITDDAPSPSQYYVEIDHWDSTAGLGVLHVGRPGDLLPSTANKTLYLYYDNDQEENTAFVGFAGSQAAIQVWNEDFRGVWHMAEPTGAAVINSTATADVNGTPVNAPVQASGRIGHALSFSGPGPDQYVLIERRLTATTDNWTLHAWINPAVLPQGPSNAAIIAYNGTDSGGYGMSVGNAGSGGSNFQAIYGSVGGGAGWIVSGYVLSSADTWYHVAITRSGGTTRFFVNGQQTHNESSVAPVAVPDRFTLGGQLNRDGDPHPPRRYFNGRIDEVRISSTARSLAWIIAEYHSGQDTLFTYGPEE